jgi:hypothetical protein
MPSFRTLLSAACVIFLACGSEPRGPKPPDFAAAFSHLPLPPRPELVSQAAGADALQLTVHSPSDMADVTDYYRNLLSSEDWRLISDTKNRDGSIVLYAEHEGPPLWVRIWKPSDRSGTLVQLSGAVVGKDRAKPDSASQPRE